MARLGSTEKLVLTYAAKIRTFTIMEIVNHYQLKREYNGLNANRRVYDAVQRLIARGLVEKVDRGVYRLVVDIDPNTAKALSSGVEDKETLFGEPPIKRKVSKERGDNKYIVRFHIRPSSDIFSFYVRVLVVKEIAKYVERELARYLAKHYSKSLVRRLRASGGYIKIYGSIVGAHGFYRGAKRGFSPLKPLYTADSAMEIGFDIVATLPVDRLFAKLYIKKIDKTLLDYARAIAPLITL